MSPLVVRLIERSPADRLRPGHGQRFALECGFDDKTAADHAIRGGSYREKGRMVGVLLSDPLELPEALHTLADLWHHQVKAQANLRATGEGVVRFDIADGAVGQATIHVERLADWLHVMADRWAERRERRYFDLTGQRPIVSAPSSLQ